MFKKNRGSKFLKKNCGPKVFEQKFWVERKIYLGRKISGKNSEKFWAQKFWNKILGYKSLKKKSFRTKTIWARNCWTKHSGQEIPGRNVGKNVLSVKILKKKKIPGRKIWEKNFGLKKKYSGPKISGGKKILAQKFSNKNSQLKIL